MKVQLIALACLVAVVYYDFVSAETGCTDDINNCHFTTCTDNTHHVVCHNNTCTCATSSEKDCRTAADCGTLAACKGNDPIQHCVDQHCKCLHGPSHPSHPTHPPHPTHHNNGHHNQQGNK